MAAATLTLGPLAVRDHRAGPQDVTATILERVRVNDDGLIFRGGRMYAQSFANPAVHSLALQNPAHFAWFLLKNYGLRYRSNQIDSGLWLLDNYANNNYFHWLIDCLTRLANAANLYPQENVLLLPRRFERQSFVNFTLQAFPDINVKWIEPSHITKVSSLEFVPRAPAYFANGEPPYHEHLVREVANRVGALVDEAGSRRIYFSRADASRRRARNEAEVVRVLRQHEVEVITIDPSRPADQIRATRGAELIVGVHGAALANMIFMSPGGRVIELRREVAEDDVFFYDWYGPLARTMGLEHRPQPCEPASPSPAENPRDADIVVDLDLLRENLR